MTAVDAMFRDRFADRREPLVEPTQRVSVIGWNDTPPSPPPAPSFADYITGKNEELRARLNDPDRTGLLPPVTSRRGAA
ncbi:hypothetical protein QQG74_09980 [Micromonospora sp. FIMYZ51]|uniref:hypothetical protein n=1 Tax=Micromonospora sp. FIMYZ51 TaxID=3051832 RepID=UPI0031204992